MSEVPTLDITVDPDDLNKGIYQVLDLLRKDWKREDVKVKNLGEHSGQCNVSLACYVNDNFDDAIVFRVHTDRFAKYIDADTTAKRFLLLHDIGVGPPVECRLKNGLCYKYIKGKIFTILGTFELRDLTIAKLVAVELAKIHSQNTIKLAKEKYNITPENCKWGIFDMAMTSFDEPMASQEAQELFDSDAFPTKEVFLKERDVMENVIKSIGFNQTYSHNDCHFGNIIYNEEEGRLALVDYDVCAYNIQGFDLSQYLITCAIGFLGKWKGRQTRSEVWISLPINQYASVLTTTTDNETKHVDGIDRKGIPYTLVSQDFQRNVCRTYLDTLSRLDKWDRDVTQADVERLHVQIRKSSLYLLLYLSCVSVLVATKPAKVEGITPYSYTKCALDLWNLYISLKDEVLSLELPPGSQS